MKDTIETNGYDPNQGKPLTAEDIDFLWDEDTTSHILNIETFEGKLAGGHSVSALESHYMKSLDASLKENERPFTIDFVAETDYQGYYIYYIRSAVTINRAVKVDNKGRIHFLPEVSAKHVIDTKEVPIDEYFLAAKEALIGQVPIPKQERFRCCGQCKNGIPFTAHIEFKDSKWHFLTVYPTLKEKEKTIEKGMWNIHGTEIYN